MASLLAVVDWGAVGGVGGVVAVLLGALIRLMVVISRLEAEVKEHHAKVNQNARHLDSTINATWMLTMRVATMEDFLERTVGYHPPVIIPRTVDGDDKG